MTQLLYSELMSMVGEYANACGLTINPTTYMTLANRGCDAISEAIGGVFRSWVSPTDFASGRVVTTPTGVLKVESVQSDGVELDRCDFTDLEPSEWASLTCLSRYATKGGSIFFDGVPGVVTIWGRGTIGRFSSSDTSISPLRFLPEPAQWSLINYILAKIPVPFDNAQAVAMKSEHAGLWEQALSQLPDAMRRRENMPYTGGD